MTPGQKAAAVEDLKRWLRSTRHSGPPTVGNYHNTTRKQNETIHYINRTLKDGDRMEAEDDLVGAADRQALRLQKDL